MKLAVFNKDGIKKYLTVGIWSFIKCNVISLAVINAFILGLIAIYTLIGGIE